MVVIYFTFCSSGTLDVLEIFISLIFVLNESIGNYIYLLGKSVGFVRAEPFHVTSERVIGGQKQKLQPKVLPAADLFCVSS